jgi:hypothetical protein
MRRARTLDPTNTLQPELPMPTATAAATFTLVVEGRDTWTDRRLDAVERAARGRIAAHREDGRGGLRFYIWPRVRPTKLQRKEILEAVVAVAGNARWVES